MAKQVTIFATSDSGWAKVFVDGNEVLSGPGSKTIALDDGLHFLTYFIQGLAGNSYKIGISEPPEEVWEVKGTLKSNHTTGQQAITI